MPQNKLITILGPTASGKSDLAVKIAKKFNGEVISADSRQVYKGMDIGTGKVPRDLISKSKILNPKQIQNQKTKNSNSPYISGGIIHYLLDVASPKKHFTVAEYRKLAQKAIEKIFKNGKIPIICGGTGFYIQALIDGLVIPEVAPDWKLRKALEKKSVKELFKILKKLDPIRAKTIDKNNPRRLIRAIEIIRKIKKAIPPLKKNPLPYPVLMIGIKKTPEELKKFIQKRLKKRLNQGMINEIKKLRKNGVSWKRLEEFGLEYRFISLYLQKKLSYSEMLNVLQKEIEHFAKRQMTWFKKDKRIRWVKNYKEAEILVKKFL
ncbi:MAG: tRNA (adenosine(37)-N6)-dimethylallyltransferase MiaA [Candidatus Pacebacteria bacterium]|nr:tRNA (adenosine(37)-N6)-dimethylallyltransferase MiaA [Candidatus Paceibacterota bacterium]